MGFIQSTGASSSATIYAIQTIEGRRIISSNDEVYNITQFSLADDEINYQFMNSDLSIDVEDDDLANWPVLEPSSNSRNELMSKIYVNKVVGNQFISSLPDSGRYVISQITTGAQGIMNANDSIPSFMFAAQTIVNNTFTLQKEIVVDSYEIEIKKTADFKISSGADFFNFFTFDMISPIESSSFIKRTDKLDSVKYVFNTHNSAGELYQYNQLGVKVIEMQIGLDIQSVKYQDFLSEFRLMNVGKNLLYQNMVTIRPITNIVDFDNYSIDTNTKSISFDVLIKL